MQIISLVKKGFVGMAVSMIGLLPVMTAGASADSSQNCTPPSGGVGVNKPVGADADTYTYDCATGLWENPYYTFNPSDDVTTPTYAIVYTYDPTTGLYNYPDWIFDAPTNSYVEVTETTSTPPAGADVVGAPTPTPSSSSSPTTPDSDTISNTGPGSSNTINGDGGSITNTGPDSNNTLGGSSTNNVDTTNTNNATVDNELTQQADSGNSLVLGNTTAGDATSGDASDMANVVNMLQSTSDALGGNAITFVANINGNVDGDLLIDPASLGSIQPATNTDPNNTNNLTVNNQTNATINNNINLDAASGDATVANNTTGGNATSGSAEAIANVVNLIDSAISSGQSFVGVININGDLNGNIEIPPDLVNQLIASNVPTDTISETGPNSSNTIDPATNSTTTNVTNTNNEGINNNVNATSTSGQASETGNTTGGNATSGSATNTITAFNLTGSSVVGSNDLLVFVNVEGTWVGMIINAPAGATAAELGGGITEASNGSNNTTVNNTTNDQINNNITAQATSGNATVSNNTTAGNATSGNASTAVNLLNVENSDLSLSGWFGILFINVFGTWNGSFGPTTAFPAFSFPTDNNAGSSSSGSVPATFTAFRFIPHTSSGSSASPSSSSATTGGNGGTDGITETGNNSLNAILVSKHNSKTPNANTAPTPKLETGHRNLIIPIVSISLFVTYIVGERLYTIRSRTTA